MKFIPLGSEAAASKGMARRKVLVLAKYYPPYRGGIENSTRTFCEGLAQDAPVHVVAFNHEPGYRVETIAGVTVERFPVFLVIKSQPLSFRYFWSAIRHKADIVHFHAPNVVASLALMVRSQRRLISIHHMDIFGRPILRMIARLLYNAVLRRSDALVVTSAKNAAISSDIRASAFTRVIPLGIDPANYVLSPVLRESGRRWRAELAQERPLVGFIGRHARYKGLDILVQAIAQLPSVCAIIAGDGPFRKDAEALSVQLNVQDRIHFVGEIAHDDKLKMLSMIDVFAFPSTEITEAFGLAQLEAMILEVPVVSSELPTGVTDVAIDCETALTVPPSDVDALAGAITRALSDPLLRARLVESARAAVFAKFTVAHMATNIRQLNMEISL